MLNAAGDTVFPSSSPTAPSGIQLKRNGDARTERDLVATDGKADEMWIGARGRMAFPWTAFFETMEIWVSEIWR